MFAACALRNSQAQIKAFQQPVYGKGLGKKIFGFNILSKFNVFL